MVFDNRAEVRRNQMTSAEITWGDPIDAANDGKPLPYLRGGERVYCIWSTKIHSGPYYVDCITGWNEDFQIKLPADHPYYLATSRGFTYWPGGDSAPDDWDGGSVLLRNGDPDGYGAHWYHEDCSSDIIGYRRRSEAVEDNGDYVRVKRIPSCEIDGIIRDADYDIERVLRGFGLVKDETLLEQFERDHGKLSENQRNCIEEFIMWQDQKNHG